MAAVVAAGADGNWCVGVKLDNPAAGAAPGRGYLADALRYAAFRKLQTAAR